MKPDASHAGQLAWAIIACIAACLAFPGCSATPSHRISHATACGPDALHDLYFYLGDDVPRPIISDEILDDSPLGNAARSVLAEKNPLALGITWPPELTGNLRRHGIKPRPISGGDYPLWLWSDHAVRDGTRGVLLLRKRGTLTDYHYLPVPLRTRDISRYQRSKWEAVRGWQVITARRLTLASSGF